MSERFKNFLSKYFNENTIDKQIQQQQEIIQKIEKRIVELNSLKEIQLHKPWYEWDSVKFIHYLFENINRYRDFQYSPQEFLSYYEFVCCIIKHLDDDLRDESDVYSSDFIIVSPTGESFIFQGNEAKILPLVTEYFERKQIEKNLGELKKEIQYIENRILLIDKELTETDKYTQSYLEQLKERKKKLVSSKDELKKKQEVMNYEIEKLNFILRKIDSKLQNE